MAYQNFAKTAGFRSVGHIYDQVHSSSISAGVGTTLVPLLFMIVIPIDLKISI